MAKFVWRRRESSSGGAFVQVERRVSPRGGKFFFQVERRIEASFFVWRGVSPPSGSLNGPHELRSKGKDGVNKNNFLGWQICRWPF